MDRGRMYWYLAILAVVVALAVWGLSRFLSSSHWQTVPGRVLTNQVFESSESQGALSKERGVTFRYEVKITYEYEVNGQRYESRKVYAGFPAAFENPKTASQVAARFPLNAAISVYVNPRNPADACLVTPGPVGWKSLASIIMFLVVVVVVITAVILVVTGRFDLQAFLQRTSASPDP